MGFFTEEANRYEIPDKLLNCHHCNNDTFYTRQEQLHSPTTTFLNLEWLDKTATCYVCSECGYIHWFSK